MHQHVSGFIIVNDENIILYSGPRPARINSRSLHDLCKKAFPDLFTFRLGIRRLKPRFEDCQKMISSEYDGAIRYLDEHNTWYEFPYVALTLQDDKVLFKPMPAQVSEARRRSRRAFYFPLLHLPTPPLSAILLLHEHYRISASRTAVHPDNPLHTPRYCNSFATAWFQFGWRIWWRQLQLCFSQASWR